MVRPKREDSPPPAAAAACAVQGKLTARTHPRKREKKRFTGNKVSDPTRQAILRRLRLHQTCQAASFRSSLTNSKSRPINPETGRPICPTIGNFQRRTPPNVIRIYSDIVIHVSRRSSAFQFADRLGCQQARDWRASKPADITNLSFLSHVFPHPAATFAYAAFSRIWGR